MDPILAASKKAFALKDELLSLSAKLPTGCALFGSMVKMLYLLPLELFYIDKLIKGIRLFREGLYKKLSAVDIIDVDSTERNITTGVVEKHLIIWTRF